MRIVCWAAKNPISDFKLKILGVKIRFKGWPSLYLVGNLVHTLVQRTLMNWMVQKQNLEHNHLVRVFFQMANIDRSDWSWLDSLSIWTFEINDVGVLVVGLWNLLAMLLAAKRHFLRIYQHQNLWPSVLFNLFLSRLHSFMNEVIRSSPISLPKPIPFSTIGPEIGLRGNWSHFKWSLHLGFPSKLLSLSALPSSRI